MNHTLSKGDQARADILNAAMNLFVSQGFNGTSMRAIADAAGYRSVAGLYNHFATKEAIFEALIEENNPYDELFGALEGALDGVDTAPQFVRAALRAVLTVMPQHFDFLALAQIDVREFEGQTIQHVLEQQVLPRLMALLAQLENLPGMRQIESAVWLRIMASLVIGYIITERALKPLLIASWSHVDWADQFADALLYGLASDPPEPGSLT
jgi:AcrR family transcriptional regulator